ncbi:MAG: N-acetyltransferase [Oscillospiraceae bacterium]|nr:N-acetyltransferase [Oscillospiraceae bacterium]
MLNIKIRNERPEDYRVVEELTKRAFHNVNFPGCDEHYLAHLLRGHADFVTELDLILELDGIPIANIMYTRSALVDENGGEKTVLTFGPLGVLPEYQRRGYGKRLLEYSLEKARELGYEAVVIFGNPENYVSSGFKSCKKYNVSLGNGEYPVPLLVNELKEGALSGKAWTYKESAAYNIDMSGLAEFDKDFPQLEKGYLPSQELFYIYSNSRFR